jgi:hypothetical protein
MLDDPALIPESVREAAFYKPCDVCPQRESVDICHAIMPVLPFLRDLDRYMSYDRVTAVYREVDSDVLAVVDTSMQEALKFICILSVMQYCEIGQKYDGYFRGVNPLIPATSIANSVYRNIFFEANGDDARIAKIIREMRDALMHTTRCQMRRIELVCKHDAFLNAYVSTYVVIQLLFEKIEQRYHDPQND